MRRITGWVLFIVIAVTLFPLLNKTRAAAAPRCC